MGWTAPLVLHSQVSTRGENVGCNTAKPITPAANNFASVIICFPDLSMKNIEADQKIGN